MSHVDICLLKVWTAVDRLSVTRKSDQSDKMKEDFFQAAVVSTLLYGCTTWTLTKYRKKKLDGNCTRMLRANIEQILEQQLSTLLPPIFKTIKSCGTLLEKKGRTHKCHSSMEPNT